MTKQNDLTRRQTLGLLSATAASLSVMSLPTLAKAPLQGAYQASFRRFKLGSFEVTTILDGAVQIPGPHPIFGQNQSVEAVEKLARQNSLPAGRMEIGFTPVIVNTGAELVLFDTGNGEGKRRPKAGLLLARLSEAGFSPDQIDKVVITHAHPDHIGGLMEGGKPAFPNARYYMGQIEYDFWADKTKLDDKRFSRVAGLTQKNVVPLAPKMTFVKGGDSVASGITAVPAFGHTPGHMTYHVESGGKRLFMMADTTNHFVVSLQRPDWHVKFDMDKEEAGQTRKKVLDMLATEKILFTGYHMPFPALGFIERAGGSYRFVAASYQLNL